MDQPKPKRQHYVPQWHLRRFRDPSAKAGQDYVVAYDRRSNTQHQRIAVTNVAVEADLYTLENPGQADAYAIENQLAEIDERENKLVDRILARRSISSKDIPAVRAMLESLHARTRDLHQRIKHAFRGPIPRQLAEQMEEEGPQPDWPDAIRARPSEYIEALKRGEWNTRKTIYSHCNSGKIRHSERRLPSFMASPSSGSLTLRLSRRTTQSSRDGACTRSGAQSWTLGWPTPSNSGSRSIPIMPSS